LSKSPHGATRFPTPVGVSCEEGPLEEIFSEPQNERTRTFLKRIIEAGRL
jgi:hypothetical protein